MTLIHSAVTVQPDMRKEVIIAIIIGISFGLFVAYGVRIAQHSLAHRPAASPQEILTKSESATRPDHTILVTTPDPEEIITDNPLKIIGTTSPLSMVSARSGNAYTTSVADETGAFTLELKLVPGPNTVVIDSFHPDGDNANVTFSAVLSSADLAATASAKPATNDVKKTKS